MTKNKDATRYYSDRQEKFVAKVINGEQTSNSDAGRFRKGDVINQRASLLCECKCVMSEKSSISIKKEWIDKNKEESFAQRLSNTCIAINFVPDGENYFVIDEKLMRYLVEKLEEDNQ